MGRTSSVLLVCYNTFPMGKDCPKNYKWMLLALLSAMYFLAQGSRQIFNAVLPQIKMDFAGAGITDVQLGFVGSAFTLVFGLTIPFGGVLADFFSRKWMVVVGSMLFAIGIFTSGFASGVGLIVLAYGVVNAAGQALLPPSNSSLIGQFHVETRATAFSIYQIVFYVGIVVCSYVSGWLSGLGAGGWRKAFFLFGAISAAWAIVLALSMRDTLPSVTAASGPAVMGWMNAHFSMSAGIASLSAFALAGAASIWIARAFFFERDKT